MEIEVGKFYKTRDGYKVIIYAIYPEKESYRNIHGAYLFKGDYISFSWLPKGTYFMSKEYMLDIISEWTESHPAESWEIDKKILVSLDETSWYRKYFAKYKDGLIYAFDNGGTSWSEIKTSPWKYAKPAEEE